jgi:hypothetical protein
MGHKERLHIKNSLLGELETHTVSNSFKIITLLKLVSN